ncbi:hypothetical protein FRB90_011002 [Tulasnella sp. 427]|nr:hypothetical protein FRB90_011002 [Tulasnella sp. 427]
MSDSKTPLPTEPQDVQLPGSSSSQNDQSPPPATSAKGAPRGPLIDIDVVPEDPTPEALELVVSPNDVDKKRDSFGNETEPLLPPPEFTEYVADYYTDGSGNIVSHDKHLNEDGEALYRFILEHASIRPSLQVMCKGSHAEWRTRQVTRYEDGKNITSTETYSETVIDFNFTLDVSSAILSDPQGAPIWIVGDKEAVNRGRRRLEVDAPPKVSMDGQEAPPADLEVGQPCLNRTWRRRATNAETEATKSWRERRQNYGYAPWVLIRGQIRGMEATVDAPSDELRDSLANSAHAPAEHGGQWYDDSYVGHPTKTLRDWADEYCASKRYLKEFKFEKVVYGWNMGALRQAIEATIRDNYAHQGNVQVDWVTEGDHIRIRADNWFSRMLDKTWLVVLLCITLIYPLFIWPFQRFSSRGGGPWEVSGSAFALCRWVHLEDSIPGETVEKYTARCANVASSSKGPMPSKLLFKATPRGISKLVGKREGEWFQDWEETIGSLVRQRYRGDVALAAPMGSDRSIGIGLAGYYPDPLTVPLSGFLETTIQSTVVGVASKSTLLLKKDLKWADTTAEEIEEIRYTRQSRQTIGYPPWVRESEHLWETEATVDTQSDELRNELPYGYASNERERHALNDSSIGHPTKTLREWADEYCASKRLLKEFNFKKIVYGWRMESL